VGRLTCGAHPQNTSDEVARVAVILCSCRPDWRAWWRTHVLPSAGNIELVEVLDTSPVGRARNRGLAQTSAPYVTWWDDDDWIAPGIVERQLALLEGGASYAGFRRGVFYDLHADRFRRYAVPRDRMIFPFAMFRRDVALSSEFDDGKHASDSRYLAEIQRRWGPGVEVDQGAEPQAIFLDHPNSLNARSLRRTQRYPLRWIDLWAEPPAIRSALKSLR